MVQRLLLLSAVFSTFLAGAAVAGPREDMLAGISRCTVFEDQKTFLDCAYGAAQPVRAQLGLPPAPQSQTRLVPSAAGVAAQMPQPDASPQRGSIMTGLLGTGKVQAQSTMASYSFDKNGYFVVTLANGEVWKQLQGRSPSWRAPAPTYQVTVRSGALGSSNLEVDGESGLFKVKRVR